MSRGRCSECGQIAGGHFTGCPETPDADESAPERLQCRSCGMFSDEVAGEFTVEKSGPICAECAPPAGLFLHL